jgi:hypothetical protein
MGTRRRLSKRPLVLLINEIPEVLLRPAFPQPRRLRPAPYADLICLRQPLVSLEMLQSCQAI